MKLVILPGMDGTGKLAKDFIAECKYKCVVIQLPEYGDQSYKGIAEAIVGQLPKTDYILLAESFSGGLVPYLIQNARVKPKGTILVASFLHTPRPVFLSCLYYLPLRLLIKIPGMKWVVKYLCMKGSSKDQFSQFWGLLRYLNFYVIKRRLKTLRKMDYSAYTTSIPVLYLIPSHDKLVPRYISNKLLGAFSNIKIDTLNGPHFLLQTKPKEAANRIEQFSEGLNSIRM